MTDTKANPNPSPGFAHDFDCTHNPCKCQHEHVWVYDHTYDDWYDGDSDDYYKCTICGKFDRRYVPR